MLKKKLGGGLLFAYVKEKKWEMDAKSGSVLPTTPRRKGIVIRKDGAPSRLGDKTIDLPSPLKEAYQGSGLRQ
jgi:hypothetical protein